MAALTSTMVDIRHHQGPTQLPNHERYETLETVGSQAFQNSPTVQMLNKTLYSGNRKQKAITLLQCALTHTGLMAILQVNVD